MSEFKRLQCLPMSRGWVGLELAAKTAAGHFTFSAAGRGRSGAELHLQALTLTGSPPKAALLPRPASSACWKGHLYNQGPDQLLKGLRNLF